MGFVFSYEKTKPMGFVFSYEKTKRAAQHYANGAWTVLAMSG